VLPYLVHETMDRLRFGICIQHSLSHLATNLAHGKIKLCLPALDFVAEEFEAVLDMNNPRFLRMDLHTPSCFRIRPAAATAARASAADLQVITQSSAYLVS
jgi:hypothetical protein